MNVFKGLFSKQMSQVASTGSFHRLLVNGLLIDKGVALLCAKKTRDGRYRTAPMCMIFEQPSI